MSESKYLCLGELIVFHSIKNKMPFLPLLLIYKVFLQILKVDIPQFSYNSPLCWYQNTLRFSHNNISIFYPVSRRRQQ